MNTLMFTITTLLIMITLTCVRVQNSVDACMIDDAIRGHIEAVRDVENQCQGGLYTLKVFTNLPRGQNKQSSENRPKASSVRVSKTRKMKRNTSRKKTKLPEFPALLDVVPAFLPSEGKASFTRQILTNLIEELYREEAFYVAGSAERIIERIAHKTTGTETATDEEFQIKPKRAEHLACIDLHDEGLEKIWLKILKGKEGTYPSLLDYIAIGSHDDTTEINVAFAPRPLLKALFPNDKIIEEVIAKREEIKTEFAERDEEVNDASFLAQKKKEFETFVTEQFAMATDEEQKVLSHLSYSLTYKPKAVTYDNIQEGDERFIHRVHRRCS